MINNKRVLSLVLALTMVFTMSVGALGNAFTQFLDTENHWAAEALENAVENGLLKGDKDKIRPNDKLTRAEMATIVNRAFGAREKASISQYTDVSEEAWYHDEMAKAVKMETFMGDGGGLNPDNSITRQEAFVVLARAFKLSGAKESSLNIFSDKGEVSVWAKDGLASLVSEGYIAGSNGKLNPKEGITRAEFAQVMDNLIKTYVNEEGTYDYVNDGNVMVNVPNVTLKDLTVKGDLIIGDGVGDGEVILDNVTVMGRTLIRGGGENSIVIRGNSNIQNIIIARVDGVVRVFAEDGTEIGEIIVDGKDDVIIEGNFASVTVIAPEITVQAINAELDSAKVIGENSRIIVGKDSKIGNIVVEGKGTEITGEGQVTSVEVKADDVKVDTPNTKVTAAEGTTGVTADGQEVEAGTTFDPTPPPAPLPSPSPGPGPVDTRPVASVEQVEGMITKLPSVPEEDKPEVPPEVPDVIDTPKPEAEKLKAIYDYLEYLENAEAIAEAREAFDSLGLSNQNRVNEELVGKLNAAEAKITELKSFIEDNTTVTAWASIGGDAGKGRIGVNVIWPFYTADGFNEATGLTSLEEYLYNDEEIVRNKANLEKLSPNKESNWPTRLTGSFDLGAARTSSSWNTGMYNLIGYEVTQDDLPNKVVVEFIYKGVLFVIEKEVEFIPEMFVAGSVFVTPTTIQAELDNANDGAIFILETGDYGTLYLRQSESKSRSIDVTNWAGDGDMERYREFNDISIVGTAGAKVDQITVEAMLYGTKINQAHSNTEYMTDYLSSYISIKNLTIKNIDFTGNKPQAVRLQSIWGHSSINGLIIDGCTLKGKDEDKTANESFLLVANGNTSNQIMDKTRNELIMTTGRSNLTVKNCSVDNVWMPINVTERHKINISDNSFSNTGRNDILVTGTSIGQVDIIANSFDSAGERAIRLNTLTGTVNIINNTISNCTGRDVEGTTSLMHISNSGETTSVILSGNSWNGYNDDSNSILLEIDSPATTKIE